MTTRITIKNEDEHGRKVRVRTFSLSANGERHEQQAVEDPRRVR